MFKEALDPIGYGEKIGIVIRGSATSPTPH